MIELSLRVTMILGVAWLVARVLHRATAATRHLVWHCAILAALAAPILGPVIPKFELPALPLTVHVTSPASGVISIGSQDAVRGDSFAIERSVDGESATRRELTIEAISAASAYLWPIGAAILMSWFLIGWLATALSLRRAHQAPALWQIEMNALRQRLRIVPEVRLRLVAEATSPVVIGLWRPTILLPEAARGWSADRRLSVLLHELAHIHRRDLRVLAVARTACALYWFNPLVWFAAAQLRSECERACDDAVLLSGARPSSYAAHLLDIARELSPALRPTHALAMARPSQLEGRLLAVLAAGRSRVPARGSRWAVGVVVMLVMAVCLGASPSTDGQDPAVNEQTAAPRAPFRLVSVPNPIERRAAADAVARASETLETARDPQAREQAAMELIASEQNIGITPFESALDDSDQDVREKAALGLGLISTPDAIPGLLKALEDPDAQVREKAAIGLALRRDARVASALIAAMSDPDAQVREKAAISLGTSGDPRAAAVLERALQDPDAQVREQAATGLLLLHSGPQEIAPGDRVRRGLRGVVGALIGLVPRESRESRD